MKVLVYVPGIYIYIYIYSYVYLVYSLLRATILMFPSSVAQYYTQKNDHQEVHRARSKKITDKRRDSGGRKSYVLGRAMYS